MSEHLSSSTRSSSSCSTFTSENNEERHILMVSKSKSDRLLGKFFDALEYDFDYDQSSLWSPPMRRNFFVASPGIIIYSDDNILVKLRRANKKKKNNKKMRISNPLFAPYRRFFSCFNVFWCC